MITSVELLETAVISLVISGRLFVSNTALDGDNELVAKLCEMGDDVVSIIIDMINAISYNKEEVTYVNWEISDIFNVRPKNYVATRWSVIELTELAKEYASLKYVTCDNASRQEVRSVFVRVMKARRKNQIVIPPNTPLKNIPITEITVDRLAELLTRYISHINRT